MALFSKDEYLEWRNHPVTEAFLADVIDLMDKDIADLVNYAGEDPSADRKKCGRVEGLKQLADWQPEIIDEEEQSDES